jgi:hypothetical protein
LSDKTLDFSISMFIDHFSCLLRNKMLTLSTINTTTVPRQPARGLQQVIEEEDVVAKLLRVVPTKYTQLALSIETMLDMSTLMIEDVMGRLRAVDDRMDVPAEKEKDGGKLLLTEEEWTTHMKEKRRSGEGSSSRGGGGNKRREKAS